MKPEDLTDKDIDDVARTAVGRLYLDCLDATTAAPLETRQYARWNKRRATARQRICEAFNTQAKKVSNV